MTVVARIVVLVVVCAASLPLGPAVASAQPVEWQQHWPRYGVPEGVATVTFGVTALVFGALLDEAEEARWEREVLLDLPIRRLVGARKSAGERRAALVSDLMVTSMMVAPFAVHVAPVALIHENGDVAGQLALISLQSFAATFALTNVTKILVGRARPRVAECFAQQLVDPDYECEPRPTVSFFSGHSAAAFTGAGLLCVVGNNVPVYGDRGGNRVPCIAGLVGATSTAVLRIAANRHHLTDIVVGALMGLASGWMVPYLLHFRPEP